MSRKLLLLLFFTITLAHYSEAQILGGDVGADSLSSTVFPIASYLSNEGLIGGIVYNRYNYKGTAKPFNNFFKSTVSASTRGYINVEGHFEQTNVFGSDDRSIVDFFLHRYKANNYFGIGNDIPFDKAQWNNEYYYFQSLSFGLDYKFRQSLYAHSNQRFDLLAGLGVEYHLPHVRKQQSSFADQMPKGMVGGWIPYLSTGFIWENRDNEFDPHSGNRAELDVRFSPDFVSDYAITSASLKLRQYFYLFDYLTIANKLDARHVGGDVPYWEMSTLGNRETLRGYPLNRFQGNSSLSYTLEMRAWLLHCPQFFDFKFGGQLFTDVGRVFTQKNDFDDVFRDYKQTFGVGAALSVINSDFIVVGAMGFSKDISRFYFGLGYLF